MAKALLYELGKSISFGRLPLLGKVLWPMLLAASDDQGRGLAEADALKWTVCPNVPELDTENIPAMLKAMEDQEMICLYADSRKRLLYQVVRWWEFQKLQWAQRSQYEPPPGWQDRIRVQHGKEGPNESVNWDQPGGFVADQPPAPIVPPGTPPGAPPTAINQSKINKPKIREEEGAEAANAVPDGPPPPAVNKPKREAKVKEPPPAAVEAFRSATGYYPAKQLWPGIVQLVGHDPPNVARFERVCLAYVAMGWNKRNLKGMMQFYADNKIPGDDRPGKRGNGREEPAGVAAVRESRRRRGLTEEVTFDGITSGH